MYFLYDVGGLPWRKKGMKKLRHAMRNVTASTSTHCRCETGRRDTCEED
jgi:hypothetical protein